jgi:hypothetical protein
MSDGDAALAAFAQKLRGLRNMTEGAAQAGAPLVADVVQRTASAGVAPEGQAWPAKRDGGRALPRAASAITAAARGAAIVVTLTGAYVYHHYAKGKDRRRVLPDSGAGVPAAIAAAVREALRRTFERTMR